MKNPARGGVLTCGTAQAITRPEMVKKSSNWWVVDVTRHFFRVTTKKEWLMLFAVFMFATPLGFYVLIWVYFYFR